MPLQSRGALRGRLHLASLKPLPPVVPSPLDSAPECCPAHAAHGSTRLRKLPRILPAPCRNAEVPRGFFVALSIVSALPPFPLHPSARLCGSAPPRAALHRRTSPLAPGARPRSASPPAAAGCPRG